MTFPEATDILSDRVVGFTALDIPGSHATRRKELIGCTTGGQSALRGVGVPRRLAADSFPRGVDEGCARRPATIAEVLARLLGFTPKGRTYRFGVFSGQRAGSAFSRRCLRGRRRTPAETVPAACGSVVPHRRSAPLAARRQMVAAAAFAPMNRRARRDAGRRRRAVPPQSRLEAAGRLLAVRIGGARNRSAAVIEAELRQLQPLVIVIPEVTV